MPHKHCTYSFRIDFELKDRKFSHSYGLSAVDLFKNTTLNVKLLANRLIENNSSSLQEKKSLAVAAGESFVINARM